MTDKRPLVVLVLCGLTLALLLGYVVGHYSHSRLLRKAAPEPSELDTIFVKLKMKRGKVLVSRKGNGGALTSFGDAVLLLTHEGKIFAARDHDRIKETAINVPDNGFAAYQKAASGRLKNLNHLLSAFRYNDILHYRVDGRQGLIISYTEFFDQRDCYVTTLAELPLDPAIQNIEQVSAQPGDWQILYRTQPCLPLKKQWRAIEGHAAGGRMAFRAPATVYLGSGDYHWDGVYGPMVVAQRSDMDYGKVIAINRETRKSWVVSSGNRNMQGIALDDTGQLWGVEHGMRGGDELNRILPGSNYGWPKETLGTLYNKLPMPDSRNSLNAKINSKINAKINSKINYGRHTVFTAPVFAWLPSVGISSLTLVSGFHSSWDGDLLAGSLKGESLFRIRIRENRLLFNEKIVIGKRIRYVHQHSDGRIVLWTDDKQLIFLQVTEQGFLNEFIQQYMEGMSAQQQNTFSVALDNCMTCHSLLPGEQGEAPSLAKVFDAPVASGAFNNYSPALLAKGGRWSRGALERFILNPEQSVPGTRMPDPGIDDPFVVQDIVGLLEALRQQAE